MNAASKRLRLRFFPSDTAAVEVVLAKTKHSSQSNLIRAALTLYQQACSNRRMGCRIVFFKAGANETPDAFELHQKRLGAEPGKRVHTEQSIEIRVTPSDFERIESILAMDVADTVSEAVRRSVRLYAAAIEKHQDGWELVAISPSGDMLPLHLTGAGAGPSASGDVLLKKSESSGGLIFHLPKSLDVLVRQLAEHEGCSADILMADLVRTEAQTRLDRLSRGEPTRLEIPQARVEEPIEPQPKPAPIPIRPDPVVVETIAVPDIALDAINEELQKTSTMVKDLILMVGPRREQGQQAQLTDLFMAADTGFELATPSAAFGNSAEGIKDQINFINGRLNNLMVLIQLQEKPKSRPRTTKSSVDKPAAVPEGETAPAAE